MNPKDDRLIPSAILACTIREPQRLWLVLGWAGSAIPNHRICKLAEESEHTDRRRDENVESDKICCQSGAVRPYEVILTPSNSTFVYRSRRTHLHLDGHA